MVLLVETEWTKVKQWNSLNESSYKKWLSFVSIYHPNNVYIFPQWKFTSNKWTAISYWVEIGNSSFHWSSSFIFYCQKFWATPQKSNFGRMVAVILAKRKLIFPSKVSWVSFFIIPSVLIKSLVGYIHTIDWTCILEIHYLTI